MPPLVFPLIQNFSLQKSNAKLGCRKANRFWLLLNWKPLQTSFIHHSDMKENFAMNISNRNKIRKMWAHIWLVYLIAFLPSDLWKKVGY